MKNLLIIALLAYLGYTFILKPKSVTDKPGGGGGGGNTPIVINDKVPNPSNVPNSKIKPSRGSSSRGTSGISSYFESRMN